MQRHAPARRQREWQNYHPTDDAEVIYVYPLRQHWLLDRLQAELLHDADDSHAGFVDREVASACLDRAERFAYG